MVLDLLLSLLAFLTLYIAVSRIIRRYYKFPAPAFVGYFLDSRWRKYFQPARKIIERSGIEKGMHVLDLGCGPGTYTLDIARFVGKEGRICAVDIQQSMINKLERKMKRPENTDVDNIETKVADGYRLPFQDGYFDLVCMITVLPEIPDKHKALTEISRILKDDGILAISEFLPDPDYPLKTTTQKWCEESGFKIIEESGNFFNYTLQFQKKIMN